MPAARRLKCADLAKLGERLAGEEQSFREHERLRAKSASRRLFEFNVTVTTGPPESIFRHTKVQKTAPA